MTTKKHGPLQLEINDLNISPSSPYWNTACRIVRMYQEQAYSLSNEVQGSYIEHAMNQRNYELDASTLWTPAKHPMYQRFLNERPIEVGRSGWILLRALYSESALESIHDAVRSQYHETRLHRPSYGAYRSFYKLRDYRWVTELPSLAQLSGKDLRVHDRARETANEPPKKTDHAVDLYRDHWDREVSSGGAWATSKFCVREEEIDVEQVQAGDPRPSAKRTANEASASNGPSKKLRPDSSFHSKAPKFRSSSTASSYIGSPVPMFDDPAEESTEYEESVLGQESRPNHKPAHVPITRAMAHRVEKLEEHVMMLIACKENLERQSRESTQETEVLHVQEDMENQLKHLREQIKGEMTTFEIGMGEQAAQAKMEMSDQMASLRNEVRDQLAEFKRHIGEQMLLVGRQISHQLARAKEEMRVLAGEMDKGRSEAVQRAEDMMKFRLIEQLMGNRPGPSH